MTNLSLDGEDILDPEEFKGIEKAFNDIGIALRENVYDMRDFEDIIDDLASKWNDLSEVEKNSIALEAAGVRQKSVFLNIMETTARQAELYNEALNGTGATMEANEIYADSLQGKLNTLGTEWSNLAQNLISADVFKAGIDVLTGFIKVLDTLNPLVSLLANTAIPALIAVFGLGLVSAINKSVVSMGYAGTGLKQLLLDFTGLNLIAKTSKTGFLGLKLSLDGVTTSALSATTAISALRLAISTVSIVLAVLPLAVTIFNKISDSIKKTKKSTEELIEATAELNSKYKENADAILESETNLKQIQRLQELIAEGNGDPLNNLDTDQLSEYKSIVDELEQLYPSLTQGWNSYANISKEDLDILIEKERTLLQAKRDTQKLEVEAGLAEMQSAQASKEKIMQEIAEAEKREAELLAKKEDLERQIAEKKAQGESTAPVGGGFSDQSIGYMYNQSLDEQLQSTNRALEINKQKLIENQNEVIKLNTETESYVDTINSLKNKGIDININTGQFKDMSVLVEELGTQFGKVKDDAEDFAKATEANIKNHVADRLAELPNLIQDAANAFSDSMSAVDNVVKAQEELAESGQLSISTLQSMAEKYPEILMYMGDKNAMKEYLLQLYDLEAQSMQNELDNYLMLRDEETIIDAQTFQAKVANNQDYIALVASMNEFLAKNGLETYDADAKNFESLIQAKTELLNHFMNQLAQANQAVASEAAELGIKDAITNFKVTSISMPKLNFGSGSKKTSSSSSKRPSSSSSSSSSTKKEVEDMELAIDIFYKFNKAIKDVEFSLSKLDKRLEYATGKERVEIMKEQIELYQKLHDEQQKLLSAQELEYARMVKTLAGEGFKIDSTGTIENYVEKLQELIIAPLWHNT